jgi:DNA-binding PadR family transcriptional regulator
MAEDAIRLSPTSYVVLGLVNLRGPSTPYELETAVQKSVEYFWKFPHSQLYREPDRLAASGHLTVVQEVGGRRRKVFSLTARGRDALRAWLDRPVDHVFEMRDEAVLQLFFSDQLSPPALVQLAEREIALYQQRLDEYARIASRELPRRGQDRRMAPLRLGVKLAEAFREFWEEIAQEPPPPSATNDDQAEPID